MTTRRILHPNADQLYWSLEIRCLVKHNSTRRSMFDTMETKKPLEKFFSPFLQSSCKNCADLSSNHPKLLHTAATLPL